MTSTLEVVNRQLEAYNKGDYETFCSCYGPGIRSFDLNTSEQIISMSGPDFFRHYEQKFKDNPALHCVITERIVCGDLVIDKEQISNYQGNNHSELVIYQVEDGLITKMWFKR